MGYYYNSSVAAAPAVPVGRIGHDMHARAGLLVSLGGRNSRALNDVNVLEHDRCAWWASATSCGTDAGCAWNASTLACVEAPGRALAAPTLHTAGVTGLPSQPAGCAPCALLTSALECDRNYANSNYCIWCPANGLCLTGNATEEGPLSPDLVEACARNDVCFAGNVACVCGAPRHAMRGRQLIRRVAPLGPIRRGRGPRWRAGGGGGRGPRSAAYTAPANGSLSTCSACAADAGNGCNYCANAAACLSGSANVSAAPCDVVPALQVCPNACQGYSSCATCTASAACQWCTGTHALVFPTDEARRAHALTPHRGRRSGRASDAGWPRRVRRDKHLCRCRVRVRHGRLRCHLSGHYELHGPRLCGCNLVCCGRELRRLRAGWLPVVHRPARVPERRLLHRSSVPWPVPQLHRRGAQRLPWYGNGLARPNAVGPGWRLSDREGAVLGGWAGDAAMVLWLLWTSTRSASGG